MIEQGMMTLSFLRNTTVNHKLSACECIFGPFNYKSTSLATPRMKFAVHLKLSQRGSWNRHGTIGFYIDPAMNHYMCFKDYIPTTRAARITDTMTFLPLKTPAPSTSRADGILQVLQKIIKLTSTPA